MQKTIVSGSSGHMGQAVIALCDADPAVEVVAGFDILGTARSFPVYANPAECHFEADVVIDFSSPAALSSLLAFCTSRGIPVVLATTGYTPEQLAAIDDAARTIPVFRSANMSLGVNVLIELVKQATSMLWDSCDIEIVERHHRRKVDAPSGTALMLADAIRGSVPDDDLSYTYDRQSIRRPRSKTEIGISSVRGGTIAGDHQVIFAGQDEVIELSHHAASREIFAAGALRAAKFLIGQPAGLYDMSALLAQYLPSEPVG